MRREITQLKQQAAWKAVEADPEGFWKKVSERLTWIKPPTDRSGNIGDSLAAATHDGVSFGAPSQHATGEVRNIGESGLLQDDHCLRGARARTAHANHRLRF